MAVKELDGQFRYPACMHSLLVFGGVFFFSLFFFHGGVSERQVFGLYRVCLFQRTLSKTIRSKPEMCGGRPTLESEGMTYINADDNLPSRAGLRVTRREVDKNGECDRVFFSSFFFLQIYVVVFVGDSGLCCYVPCFTCDVT